MALAMERELLKLREEHRRELAPRDAAPLPEATPARLDARRRAVPRRGVRLDAARRRYGV